VINGVYRPQEGTITLRGQKLTDMTPNLAASLGISRTCQNIALFKGMTVLDNIMAGCSQREHANFLEVAFQLPRARREETANREKVEEIIEFLQIEHIRKTPVKRLPYGLQKRVELGRALAAEPKILLLDEPMAGMNIEEKHQGAAILKAGKHLGHFHACGTDRGVPGGDSLDWKPIVAALKKIGYKNDVVIESFTTDVKVIARAAAIWRKMEPNRDDIPVKGLKNMHRLFGRTK
jgi:ABC-type ATPase involved in cell division